MDNEDAEIEVGLIGCEGVSGIGIILGSDRSPFHTYMQVAGSGFSIASADLLAAFEQSPTLKLKLLRYAQAFAIQTTYTAAANAKANIESRLARWLLMARDRVPHGAIPLTHEFLSIMLGVRRSSVTEVLQPLQKQGLIRNSRGNITIADRAGVEATACECYRAVKDEFSRLFG